MGSMLLLPRKEEHAEEKETQSFPCSFLGSSWHFKTSLLSTLVPPFLHNNQDPKPNDIQFLFPSSNFFIVVVNFYAEPTMPQLHIMQKKKQLTKATRPCYNSTYHQDQQQCHAHLLEARWIVAGNFYAEPNSPRSTSCMKKQSTKTPMTMPMAAHPIDLHNNTAHTQGGLLLLFFAAAQNQKSPSCTAAHHTWKNACQIRWHMLIMVFFNVASANEKQSTNLQHPWLHIYCICMQHLQWCCAHLLDMKGGAMLHSGEMPVQCHIVWKWQHNAAQLPSTHHATMQTHSIFPTFPFPHWK